MVVERYIYCRTHGRQTVKQAKKNTTCTVCQSFSKPLFRAKRPGES